MISLFIPIIFLINQSFCRYIILALIITLIFFLSEKYFVRVNFNSLFSYIFDNHLDIEMKKLIEIFPRIDIWRAGLIAIFNKPLLGWGAASFPFVYGLYKNNDINDYILHSHNLFLESSINFLVKIYGSSEYSDFTIKFSLVLFISSSILKVKSAAAAIPIIANIFFFNINDK